MTRYIYTLIVAVLLAIGCTRDFDIEVPGIDDKEVDAILTLQIPRSTGTKALTSSDEINIETVDVLVFKRSGTDTTYFYQSFTSRIEDNAPSPGDTIKNYRVSIKADGSDQQFVVFANAMDLIRGLTLTETMTRKQVLDLVTMTISDKWNSTAGSSGYKDIPMWGQTPFRTITTAASARATITMARAVARLDVFVNTGTQSVFKLHEVMLYNAPMNGRLAPTDANWDNVNKVTGVSIPSGGWNKSSTPFSYTLPLPNDSLLSNTVYTFECPPSTSNTDPSATCLVVRGSWNGNADSYYRLDFVDPGGQFLALLRNHQYKVVISSVTGNGHASAAIAMSSGSTNISAITINLTSGDMRYVIWDGMNWLGFSDKEISFYNPAVDYKLHVATNVPAGWVASVRPADTGWLSITGPTTGHGNTATPDTLKIRLTKNTTTPRTGWIYISAGRLRDSIMITQSNTSLLWLEVGDKELAFSASSASFNISRIEWEPASINCQYSLDSVPGYNKVQFTAHPILITDADSNPTNGGAINLRLEPDIVPLTSFEERRINLRIWAVDADGQSSPVKTILLRQYDNDIVVTGKFMIGDTVRLQPITTNRLTVKSNGAWEVVSYPSSIIASIQPYSEDANTAGTTFTFKTVDLPGTYPNPVRSSIIFRHKVDKTTLQEVYLRLEPHLPNCYILYSDNGGTNKYVDIDIRKVVDIWRDDPDLNENLSSYISSATMQVVYQDAQNLIKSITRQSTEVFRITANDNGGSGLGNAAVSVTMNGSIRWVWHIWVANDSYDGRKNILYNPNNNVRFMYKSLGAMYSAPNNHNNFGVYYQHGRTMPFPGPSARGQGAPIRTIWNGSNTQLTFGGTGIRTAQVTQAMNLKTAIANPLTLYWGNAIGNQAADWYSNTTNIRGDFWSNEDEWKGTYDPCPHGWTVPTSGDNLFDLIMPIDLTDDGATFNGVYRNDGSNTIGAAHFTASREMIPAASNSISMSGWTPVNILWNGNGNAGTGRSGGRFFFSPFQLVGSSQAKTNALPVRCIRIK